MRVNPLVFREYDIRGVVGSDIDETFAYTLGRAFGTYVRRRDRRVLAVGRDCRHSSEPLFRALARGLQASGCDVVDVGVVPTPLLYFSLFVLPVQGGVQITASHNPPEFNGFKLCVGKDTLYGPQIQEVRRLMETEDFVEGTGTLRTEPGIIEQYIQHVLDNLNMGPRRVRVVVDAGNGTAGPVAPVLYERMGCAVTPLYCEMDGSFPNHHPDPVVPENIRDLRAKVLEVGADLGIGFDGDADRIGVVDERGEIIWGDQLLIIFARDLLSIQRDVPVIFEVKCTLLLEREIERLHGIPVMWKAGHSLIKAKMRELAAPLAGEMSGHMFFGDRYFGYDDAIYAGARLLEILSHSSQPLSAFLADLPKTYATPEIRVACPDEVKFRVVERVTDHFRRSGRPIVDVDGVRVKYEDGWGLVRASNTQPALVLRFEALSEEALRRIQAEVYEVVYGTLRDLGVPTTASPLGH
jgi:phosphomannomutase/phosphoglucomutase